MIPNKEITALLHLIDDPDKEVFDAVSERIADYGKPIIPSLEHLWENSPEPHVQERIEQLIHKLHYRDLCEDMNEWALSGHHDLIAGALLVSKFQYPDLSAASVLTEIEKIRRNIWLELNNYLTPLEQVNVMTSILYGYYGLKGNEISYSEPNDFLFHKMLEIKRGNQLSNGLLYLLMGEMQDIPVKAISIPRQFILAYFQPGYSDETQPDFRDKILFFIDPISGQVFTHDDVENYFKRLKLVPESDYFRPLASKKVIQHLLNEYSKCFDEEKVAYKKQELQQLASLLD